MKKIYALFGAAALLMLGSCAKDAGDDSQPVKGANDFYMTLAIAQPQSTRTATTDQGKEVGKDYENTISKAILVFADEKFETVTSTNFDVASAPSTGSDKLTTHQVTFSMERDVLTAAVGESASKKFYLFLIANPGNLTKESFAAGVTVQKVLEQATDENVPYWKENQFLMTNAELTEKVIIKTDINKGTHKTADDAYSLGTIKVQRAVSRFDIAKDNVTKTFSNEKAPIQSLTVTFDAVALVNMAQSFNLFKVVAAPTDEQVKTPESYSVPAMTLAMNTTNPNFWGAPAETATNYVFSPEQTAWTYPLFDGGVNTGGAKWTTGNQKGTMKSLNDPSFKFDSFGEWKDDNDFTHPGDTQYSGDENYYIWRYCTENTNFNLENQLNGNTTGVIFRAKMTATELTNGYGPVYAYQNVILGNAAALRDYVSGADPEDGIWGAVKHLYKEAVKKAKAANSGWNADKDPEKDEDLKTLTELDKLDQYLTVKDGITIYRPDEDGNYYCYYYYWNRHNDNGQPVDMGPMEFATVRNNVYKLQVTKIMRLGHPAEPGDDPDEPDPNDPDEEDSFYCKIECKILPWEVRMNGIEF